MPERVVTEQEAGSSAYAPSYTALLLAFGVLAVGAVGLETLFLRALEAGGEEDWIVWLLRIDLILALVLAPAALLTALARLRGWHIAEMATRVVSFLLVPVVPLGTAAFLYWWFWVRRSEGRARQLEAEAE